MNKLVDIVHTVIENNKCKDMYRMMKEIGDIHCADEVTLHDVIKELNERKIRPYEPFYIYGYLSSTACLEIPETYFNELREYVNVSKEYNNGKLYNQAQMIVSENNLPQCHPKQGNDYCIAFLYKDRDQRFKAAKNEEGVGVLNEFQQFIPVILENKDYYKYVDMYVRLKCCAIPIDKLYKDKELNINYIDNKYLFLNECFFDIYQPHITSFILESLDITDDISLNYDKEETSQFIIEYEILSNVSSRGLFNNVNDFLKRKEINGLPNSFKYDTGHIMFVSHDNISVCIKNRKIGFYSKVHINNPVQYKHEIQDLENYIKSFFKKNRYKKEISFISDYRRIDIFDKY